jgi:hypothetical protein
MVVPKEFSLTRWVEKLEELDADLVAVTLNDNLQGMLGATVMIVDKQVCPVVLLLLPSLLLLLLLRAN